VSFEWNNLDLRPKTLALMFNNTSDVQMFELKTQKKYIDNEVRKFKDPIILKLPSEWKIVEKQYKKINKTTYKSVAYKSGSDLLMAIDCEYRHYQDDAQMLIYITKDYFVIVGVVSCHPFVETPYISYGNSDGSGPNILLYHKKNVFNNPKYIAFNLEKYYNSFIKD
jgi:hypothetical protein